MFISFGDLMKIMNFLYRKANMFSSHTFAEHHRAPETRMGSHRPRFRTLLRGLILQLGGSL